MANAPRLISVIGKKNCGKTTLVIELAKLFARKGLDVATIKHGTHAATLDTEGTDTWRHANEGNARRVLMVGPEERFLVEKRADDADPIELARTYFSDADIIILEGFTSSPVPKIEVFRSEIHDQPRWSADHEHSDKWIAMLTDQAESDYPFPVFRFQDTAWLMTFRGLAWENALILD